MGMAGGAFEGDKERARQAAIASQQAASFALRKRELDMRQQVIDDARRERAAAAERASMQSRAGGRAIDAGAGVQSAAPAERQSPYSVSAFDLGAAARQRANDQRLMALERQNNTLGQFQQVVNMERQQAAARKAQGQATVASLMKMAKMNGGAAPIAALQLATRQMGFDGKTSAIGGAGFTANGDFFMDFVQKDAQTGQMSRATNLIGLADQGRIYYGQQGIFDNADRAAWRNSMRYGYGYDPTKGANGRTPIYSTDEINQYAGLNATAIQGLDEKGRARLDQGFVDPSGASDWKREIAERKMALQEQRFARALGQQSLDAAQKYALYHFKEFIGFRPATEDDVKKGVLGADKVGSVVKMSNEEAFNSAVDFYKRRMQNQDPATNPQGGQGGQQPTPGTEANPPAPGSEAQPPAVGEEANPEANAYGGNLQHEGRKWKLYTDDNGKVTGYGTTKSMYTKTDDGKYAVIPMIIDGVEVSPEEAVAHYKKTGEHWGIADSEDAAKELSNKVHLDGQEHERAAWNEYIQNHWDEMSEEIQNDPGTRAEHDRRAGEGQGELQFGGVGGAPAEGGGEAAPAPAEGAAPAGGGDGAPPPPPPPPPAEGGEVPAGGEEAPADVGGAGGAGGAPAEGEPGEEEEDDKISASNPFAKWITKKNHGKKK